MSELVVSGAHEMEHSEEGTVGFAQWDEWLEEARARRGRDFNECQVLFDFAI